jgi:hypothetical protein
MAAESKFAGADRSRWQAPRWLIEAWLWISTTAAIFEVIGCPDGRLFEACVRYGNAVGSLFDFFPGVAAPYFVKIFSADLPAVLAALIVASAMSDALIRWVLPVRMRLHWFLLTILGWVALSWVCQFYAMSALIGRLPFWPTFGEIYLGLPKH